MYKNKTEEINVWITFPSEMDVKKRYPYEKGDVEKLYEKMKKKKYYTLKREKYLQK